MTIVFFSEQLVENTLMTDKKWDKLKCPSCKVLFEIEKSTGYEEVKVCPKCGQKRVLIKGDVE